MLDKTVLEIIQGDPNQKLLIQMTIQPWTEVVHQILESKKALFYIFNFNGSVFQNSKKPTVIKF